jgi:hypothetical protein
MQKKVRWVDENTGEQFFECSQAEARIAMRAVDGLRKGQQASLEEEHLRTEIERVMKFVKAHPIPNEVKMYAAARLSAQIMTEFFTAMETQNVMVTHILMSARRYADLRMWDKDTMDLETLRWKLVLGQMATMWGANIIVWREIPDDEVVFVHDRMTTGAKECDIVMRWKVVMTGPDKTPVPPSRTEVMLSNILERLAAIEAQFQKPSTVVTSNPDVH